MFENFPALRSASPTRIVTELLDKIGPVPQHARPCLLLYAERDIPMTWKALPG